LFVPERIKIIKMIQMQDLSPLIETTHME
jgi:hypothetical protein